MVYDLFCLSEYNICFDFEHMSYFTHISNMMQNPRQEARRPSVNFFRE
jgi:hypothetical protein